MPDEFDLLDTEGLLKRVVDGFRESIQSSAPTKVVEALLGVLMYGSPGWVNLPDSNLREALRVWEDMKRELREQAKAHVQ